MQVRWNVDLAVVYDAAQIADLSEVEIEYGLRARWNEPAILIAMKDVDTNVAVVRNGAVVLGFGIMKYSDEVAHLLLLAVQRTHRRLGMASALVHWLEEVATASGIRKLQVEARVGNTAAIELYLRLGYVKVRVIEGMYQQIDSGIRFEKRLIKFA